MKKAVLLLLAVVACRGASDDENVPHEQPEVDTLAVDTAAILARPQEQEGFHSLSLLASRAAAVSGTVLGDSANGRLVYGRSCGNCHAATQGWDLAHLKYPDTVIFRRATPFHVTPAEAQDIVAHVASLVVADTMTRSTRPLQPGKIVLGSDIEFGTRLFGVDQWPASLTRAQVLAQKANEIPIALPLPLWSDETSGSGFEWLPDSALPAKVREAAQPRLDDYERAPTISNAMIAARRVRTAAHDGSIADAPCTYGQNNAQRPYDPRACADVATWTAAFVYTAGVRSGDLHGALPTLTDAWWETGHFGFNKAQQFRRNLPHRDLDMAAWFHLGWMWDHAIGKHTSYEAGPLANLGLGRHVTWMVNRTIVERRPGQLHMCVDVETLARDGSTKWMHNAVTFAYHELLLRDKLAQLPSNKNDCATRIDGAQRWIEKRMGLVARNNLQPLADSVKTAILQ